MKNARYQFFTSKELKAKGWLLRQLRAQADGLCGNLDKVWPDVRDSKWIGGDREGWERVPYWLDGFIPMAWLLDDGDLKARAKKYIDAILAGQADDGWICPCAPQERMYYDVWAVFLICKVLVVYHDCSGDDRIPGAVYKALRCLSYHVEKPGLFAWGAARWYECLIPLAWLYERRPEPWMPELAVSLKAHGTNYPDLFAHWPFEQPQPRGRWNFLTHVVNLAMCLRSEALFGAFTGGRAGTEFAEKALETLLRDHGMPAGHFTGDECLAGRSPVQGTELCGVVEAMYSYEWLLALSGGDAWADRLERLAFNALPAAISGDMWSHQYDQLTNQALCQKLEKSHFMTNDEEAHLFGLEPHYGCCTANFGQGWPKLALSGLLRETGGEGLAVGAIVPCALSAAVNGVGVTCEIETGYPFRDSYTITVITDAPVRFPLSLRFPASARRVLVDGKEIAAGSTRYRVEKTWQGKTTVNVEMDFAAVLEPFDVYGKTLWYLRRGNVVYALPIKARREKREYTRGGVERKSPYCDYELFPESEWRYGFVSHGEGVFAVKAGTDKDWVFKQGEAPAVISVPAAQIDWPLENGTAAPVPASVKAAGPETAVEFIPYGWTDLRMTALPRAEK